MSLQDHAEAPRLEIDDARARLQAGDLAASLTIAEGILHHEPADADALYIAAVSLRHLTRIDDALTILDRLLLAKPGYGRAFQEQGYCHRAAGRRDEAIEALERATAANPGLVASWRAIGELQTEAGRPEKAAAANGQVKWLGGLPPELVSVISFLHEGRLYKAEQLCRAYLQQNGHHFEAMRLLAELGVRAYAMEEAEFLLESCAVLRPDYLPARFDYIRLLNKRQKFEAALKEAEATRDLAGDSLQFKLQYANQHLAVGNFDTALQLYDELHRQVPDDPIVSLTQGHALKTVGRQEDAVTAYRRAYTSRPDLGDAFWSLANLKTYRFLDHEIAQMRTAEASPQTSAFDRYSLCFALGKALEDRGDYAQSFSY